MSPSIHLYLQAAQLVLIFAGFWIGIKQLIIRARAHLFNVYRQAVDMVDGIRDERHYVAGIDRNETFKQEKWVNKSECDQKPEWKMHREKAEKVFRCLDQFGLLVREGRIPVNVVARFYVRPILQAWHQLRPYIMAVRKDRPQPSHGWEFENLVHRIILPGLNSDRGVWKGVKEHDFPSLSSGKVPPGRVSPRQLIDDVTLDKLDEDGDLDYEPGTKLWKIQMWHGSWL